MQGTQKTLHMQPLYSPPSLSSLNASLSFLLTPSFLSHFSAPQLLLEAYQRSKEDGEWLWIGRSKEGKGEAVQPLQTATAPSLCMNEWGSGLFFPSLKHWDGPVNMVLFVLRAPGMSGRLWYTGGRKMTWCWRSDNIQSLYLFQEWGKGRREKLRKSGVLLHYFCIFSRFC